MFLEVIQDFVGNLFSPEPEVWIDCNHEREVRKQLDAMPNLANETGLKKLVLYLTSSFSINLIIQMRFSIFCVKESTIWFRIFTKT